MANTKAAVLPGELYNVHFSLEGKVLSRVDVIAEKLSKKTGFDVTRSDVIRAAIKSYLKTEDK